MNNNFSQAVIERYVEEHRAHYDRRLVSIYVEGSVHRDEAIPGVSDLDTYVFIDGEQQESDKKWQEQTQAKLRREILGFHVIADPMPVQEAFPSGMNIDTNQEDEVLHWSLFREWGYNNPTDDPEEEAHRNAIAYVGAEETARRNAITSFGVRARELRYDATLVWGRDLIAGMTIPPWNRLWAQAYHAYYQMPREVARYAAGLEENNTVFRLPDVPPLRLRKLGRLGLLCGAALLMGYNDFHSYKAVDVLPLLKQRLPRWNNFLDETGVIATQLVVASDERVATYTDELVSWAEWVGQQLHDE